MSRAYQVTQREGEPTFARSFVCYEIPFRPDREIPYASTEGLCSYYIVNRDSSGKVVRFTKILLERQEVRDFVLTEKRQPFSTIYFQADPSEDGQRTQVGRPIPYLDTFPLALFFEGKVDESGQRCQLTLYRKLKFFEDQYSYWSNGRLRERLQIRGDQSETYSTYDENGVPQPLALPASSIPQ